MHSGKPAYHAPYYPPHVTPPIDPLLPVQEGFTLAGLRTTKGYEEAKLGRLKLVRNGRRTFIRASEVTRYIASLEAVSEKEAA
jgi:hypothetical protein